MKKTTFLFAIGLLFIVLTSFNSSNNTDWGPWQTSSCYKGLDFCVKKNEYNQYAKKHNWSIKFRNRYNEKVSFGFVLKESNVNSAKGTHRVTVQANSEGSGTYFLVADANSVRAFIDQLRFGDDWGTNHAPCDN
ncbi:MAG: hypothetical protein WBA61_17080 [Aequorivita sp.]